MHRSRLLVSVLILLALVAAACGGSSDDDAADTSTDEATPTEAPADDEPATDDATPEPEDEPAEDVPREASDIGVTEDTIRIGILNADLDGLRDLGFDLGDVLTTEYLSSNIGNFIDRWNAAGGINGRQIETVTLGWNPLDTETMQNACVEATLDNELFMVVNASGFSTAFIDCFTVDSDMLFLFGETASQAQIDRAPDRLFTLLPPAELAAKFGVQVAEDNGVIAPGDKVGVLSGNAPGAQAAAAAAQEALEAGGHEVVVREVNTQSNDNSAMNAESTAAVADFNAEGVDHALVLIGFTTAAGFWNEVGELQPDWGRTIIDASSATCTPFGASRTVASADGAVCVTAWDAYTSVDGGGVRPDTPYEAECRATFISDYTAEYGGRSDPGVPAGQIIETVDGESLSADYALSPCTLADILFAALSNAGVNPTRDSVAAALREVSGPIAFASNGEGTFGPDKNFYSTQVHAVRFTVVDGDEPRGADGTFAGCPAPVNCWVELSEDWLVVE